MNQILEVNFKKNNKNNNKNIFKILFTFSMLLLLILIVLIVFNINNLINNQKLSDKLLENYNISNLYSYTNLTTNLNNNTDSQNSTEIFGIIKIPKINIKYTIYSTLSDEQLKISPCKFYGSNPLYNGNICIAGHNYNNSIFFSNIDKLDANDEICIYYMNIKFIYYVTNKYEVNENDLSPIYNYDRNSKELTLVSCNNLNKNRIIIKAKQK